MNTSPRRRRGRNRAGASGQIIVLAAMAMIALIGGVALVLEGGNAYAHQRSAQNGTDAVANGGATVLAAKLGGATKTDADVVAISNSVAGSNGLTGYNAWYTDVAGHLLTMAGASASNTSTAARVGDGTIPPGAQGVQVTGNQAFGSTFGRVIGFDGWTASGDATAITGAANGGRFLPVVFPVNIVDCEQNGSLGTGEANWQLSQPGSPPVGQEYIVPLCKTGEGSFMMLDLDGTRNNCEEEVLNPPAVQFESFPVDIASDNGNNCAKQIVDEVNALHGQVVLIPICDGQCVTTGGSRATYHIIKVAAFYVDYMSDENGGGSHGNSACQGNGTTLIPIAGNGSSSCIAGWFVRYITSGPVGAGPVTGAGAIAVQLIR